MKQIGLIAASLALLSGCSNPAEEAVRAELIDPDSAEFRDVEACLGDSGITTGEVNGKNRMGAFTGFEFFFVEAGKVYFAGTDGVMDVMDRCYKFSVDTATGGTAEGNPGAAAADAGDWITSTDRDPIDDSAVITASLVAESGQAKFGEPVGLVARCGSNKTDVYAVWNEFVGDDSNSPYEEFKNVEVRVGGAPARTERWVVSTDKQATFAGSAVSLLKEMSGKEKLVLRITPYGENPVTAIFNLKGIEEAIEPIARECKWEL